MGHDHPPPHCIPYPHFCVCYASYENALSSASGLNVLCPVALRMTDSIKVGPYVLETADLAALQSTVKWSSLDRLLGLFQVIIGSAGFIFTGYVVARLTLGQYMDIETFNSFRLAPIVAAALLYVLFTFWLRARSRRQAIKGYLLDKRPQILTFNQVGVDAMTGDIRSHYPWHEIDRVVAAPKHVILFISGLQGIVVPHRAFASSNDAKALATKAAEWLAVAKNAKPTEYGD